MMKWRASGFVLLLGAALMPLVSMAQAFPDRPIRILVGFAPGGGVDILGRLVSQKLSERLKVPVPFENRPGANSMIAAGVVARAKPDGYTLLMITTSHILNAAAGLDLAFDPVGDFSPVAELAAYPNILAINGKVPAGSLREFIALVKANPGNLNFASTGVGGATHMAAEIFMRATNVNMVHVPYQGAGLALTGLRTGEVSSYFGTIASIKPFLDGGIYKVLAVMSEKRSPALPEVPTMREGGVDALSDGMYGVLAPARTSADIVTRLNAELGAIMQMPEFSARLAGEGATPINGSPAAFKAYIASQVAQLGPLVKAASASIK